MLRAKRVVQTKVQAQKAKQAIADAQTNGEDCGENQILGIENVNTHFLPLPKLLDVLERRAFGAGQDWDANKKIDADRFESEFWQNVRDQPNRHPAGSCASENTLSSATASNKKSSR